MIRQRKVISMRVRRYQTTFLTLLILFAWFCPSAFAHPRQYDHLSENVRSHLMTDSFQEIDKVADLPDSVKSILAPGISAYIANPGQPYNFSDVIETPAKPFVRLDVGGEDSNYCLLCLEHGGFVTTATINVYDLHMYPAKLIWSCYVSQRPPKTLSELQQDISNFDPTQPRPSKLDNATGVLSNEVKDDITSGAFNEVKHAADLPKSLKDSIIPPLNKVDGGYGPAMESCQRRSRL